MSPALRYTLIAAVGGAAIWYSFIRGTSLTEQDVRKLVDEADAAYLSGSVPSECALRSKDFKYSVTDEHYDTTAREHPKSLAEISADDRRFANPDDNGQRRSQEITWQGRESYCPPQWNAPLLARDARSRRVDLSVTLDQKKDASYRARYVMLEPVPATSDLATRFPGSSTYTVSDVAGTVILEGRHPRISTMQSSFREYWLEANAVPEGAPVPAP